MVSGWGKEGWIKKVSWYSWIVISIIESIMNDTSHGLNFFKFYQYFEAIDLQILEWRHFGRVTSHWMTVLEFPRNNITMTWSMNLIRQERSLYRPVYHHWFYRKDMEKNWLFQKEGELKSLWKPFSMSDSLALERAYSLRK